jgi:hypothetical protein
MTWKRDHAGSRMRGPIAPVHLAATGETVTDRIMGKYRMTACGREVRIYEAPKMTQEHPEAVTCRACRKTTAFANLHTGVL